MNTAIATHQTHHQNRQQTHTRMRILPRVWATASLNSAAVAVQQRKRPHCLRLVKAAAAVVALKAPTAQRDAIAGLVFYREYTEAILRRYMTMSMESGRVPSLLGRELFSGNVTNYRVTAFDDAVIFVADVGRCLEQLEPGLRHLVRRVAIEGYTREETAAMLGVSFKTVVRRYGEAIDKLTRLMLDRGILKPMMESRMQES